MHGIVLQCCFAEYVARIDYRFVNFSFVTRMRNNIARRKRNVYRSNVCDEYVYRSSTINVDIAYLHVIIVCM